MTSSKDEPQGPPSEELLGELPIKDLTDEERQQFEKFKELFEETLRRPDTGRIIVTKLPRED